MLGSLSIKKVEWDDYCYTLGVVLSDEQSCKAGTSWEFNNSHIFNEKLKITKVEVIVSYDELDIMRIHFYSG